MAYRCEHDWPGSGCRECFPINKIEEGKPIPVLYSEGAEELLEQQMNPRRYRLAQDDSCHWYLIPADRQKDWWDWMESEDAKLGVEPEWAKRIDGWSLLTFTDPQEDN